MQIGEFERNHLEEGYIYLQLSPLIPEEARTEVLVKDYNILAALITINPNTKTPNIMRLQFAVALGGLGLNDIPDAVDLLFERPKPSRAK